MNDKIPIMKSRLSRRRRGFAMVLSLFLVMILYTGMTVMVANHRTETGMSHQAFETAQYRFATQGAVNKLHTLLQHGNAPEDFPQDRPLEVSIGRFENIKAWVIEDESSGIYHLRSEMRGVSYSKVIAQGSAGGAVVYSNDGGTLKFAGIDDAAWTDLPSPPPKGYDELGLQIDVDDLQATQYFRANHEGQMAAVFTGQDAAALYLWDEGTQSWGDIPPAPGWRPAGDEVEQGGAPSVRMNAFLGEETLFCFTNVSRTGSSPVGIVSYYDLTNETWSDVRGPFGGQGLLDGFLGPDDTFIAEVQVNGTTRAARLVGNTWNELPPLPQGASILKVRAAGPEGELYANSTAGELYKFSEGQWSSVSVPLSSEGLPLGTLRSVDAEGGLLFHDTDQGQVSRWDQSSTPKALPEVEEFFGIAGGGNDEEVVDEGFTTTATY